MTSYPGKIRSHTRRIYVPQSRESTYGEGDTSFDFAFNVLKGSGQIRAAAIKTDDTDSATGEEFAIAEQVEGFDLPPQSFAMNATPEGLGWAYGMALGSCSTVGATNYAHTITPRALSNDYPGSFGLEDHSNGATVRANGDQNHRGVYVTEVSTSFGLSGKVRIDVTVAGSGERGTPATITESGLTVAGVASDSTYFTAGKWAVYIQAATTEHESPWGGTFTQGSVANTFANSFGTNITELVQSGRHTVRDIYGTKSRAGLYGDCPELIRREIEMELTWKQSTSFETLVNADLASTTSNNVEYAVGAEFVSGVDINTSDFPNGVLLIPLAKIHVPQASGDDIATDTMTFMAKADQSSNNYAEGYVYVHDAVSGNYCGS